MLQELSGISSVASRKGASGLLTILDGVVLLLLMLLLLLLLLFLAVYDLLTLTTYHSTTDTLDLRCGAYGTLIGSRIQQVAW